MSANVAKLKKKAAEFEQKKQFDKALAVYIQILDGHEPGDVDVDVGLFNRVGDLLLRQGNIPDAVNYYEKAVDLYAESGFFNNAIALCNKILRQSPGRNSIYYKLGKISAKKGFKSDAKQNFLEYADRMQQAGQIDEAFRALKEFADLCPDQDDIRLMLAEQLAKRERKAEAIDQLQTLYERFESEGRDSEARATLDRMKAIDPEAAPRESSAPRQAKSGDLVFLDVDFGDAGKAAAPRAAPRPAPRPTVKLQQPPEPAAPAPRPAPVADLPLLDTGYDSPAPAPDVEEEPVETPLTEQEFAAMRLGTPADLTAVSRPEHDLALPGELPMLDVDDGQMLDMVMPEDDSPSLDELVPPIGRPTTEAPAIDVGGLGLEIMHTAAPDGLDAGDFGGGLDLMPTALDGPSANRPVAPLQGLESTRANAEPDFALDSPIGPLDGSDDGLLMIDELPDEPPAREEMATNGLPMLEPEAAPPRRDSASTRPTIPVPASDIPQDIPGLDEPLEMVEEAPIARAPRPAPPRPRPIAPPPAKPASEMPRVVAEEPRAVDSTDTVARLTAQVAAQPGDPALRRQLAEALLARGQRAAGLEALEEAMLGYERIPDLDGARSVAEEIIRADPNSVRHHQKRVEYAFRTADRPRLVDAYLELADSLLRTGQADKSRAVYQRVLELAPNDQRAQAALSAVAGLVDDEVGEEVGGGPRRYTGEVSRMITPAATAPASATPGPRGDDSFVNLGDWLRSDEAPKSTRMVVAEEAPSGDEQADFADMLRKFKQGVSENVDEEDFDSHYDLGVAYKEMGLLDEAIAEFQKALRAPERRVRTYEALGQCFLEKKQWQVASTILQRALAEPGQGDEKLVGVLYLLGYASEALQRPADALLYYQRVFAVDIQFRDVGERLNAVEKVAR